MDVLISFQDEKNKVSVCEMSMETTPDDVIDILSKNFNVNINVKNSYKYPEVCSKNEQILRAISDTLGCDPDSTLCFEPID